MQFFLILFLELIFAACAFADANLGLPPLLIPVDNLQTDEKIELGKALFNDKRFSADGSVSCASCHHANQAFTDGLPVAKGFRGQLGTRNAPTVVNAAFYDTLFLDGRAKSLEDQALGPFVNPIEHGLQNHHTIVGIVQHDAFYSQKFNKAFSVQTAAITIEHVVKAIAAYERTLIAGNSPFDRYLFGRDQSVLSDRAARGLSIFKNKGNCVTCHEISWNNALFSDNRFYNIGVGSKRLTPVLDGLLAFIKQGGNLADFSLTEKQRSELGRFNVTKNLNDIGKFKTPTLRNIELTAPYMHDGSLNTLTDVIEYYDKGGDKNRFIDTKIFPLHLTQQEKEDLIAFMQALTSQKLPK